MIGRHRNIIQLVVALLLASQLTWAATIASGATPQPQERHGPLSIAVLGDQITAGINNRVVWPTLLAAKTGWSVSNYALPEAGFAADGAGCHTFGYQVDRAQAGRPRMLLFLTGTADASVQEPEAVTIGALDAINKALRGGQQVAVIGPVWYETPVPESVWRANDAIEKVARSVGVPFLNAVDPPLIPKKLMLPDLSGPSDAAQSLIADKVAAWLRTQVVQ